MPNSTQNDWEDRYDALTIGHEGVIEPLSENIEDSAIRKNFIRNLLADARKAYGGCNKCYGKGYSTVRYGRRYSADFEGDKTYIDPIKTNIHFCDCDRGKQIEKLLADARKDERMKAEVEMGLKNFKVTMEEISKARKEVIEKVSNFEQKVNVFDMSKDCIDDDNKMLARLIADCRQFLATLKEETNG